MSEKQENKQNENQQEKQEEHQEEEQTQQKQIKIRLFFLNKLFLPLEISGNDNLGEIKVFLNEQTILNLYTSFYFEYEGQRLSEYVEISTFEIPENGIINIKLDPLDEKSAKAHVKKINNILNNPAIFQNFIGNQKSQTEQYQEQEQKAEESKKQNQSNKQEQKNDKQDKQDKQDKNQQQPNESESEDDEQMPDIINISEALYPSLSNQFLSTNNSSSSNSPISQTSLTQLICFLNYSGFNPVPSFRKLRGDLFYLILRTLENVNYHITASPKGFYLNKSNMKFFDPEPLQNAKYYISLLDLISSLSPQFKKNFQKQINQKQDPFNLQVNSETQFPQTYRYGTNWLSKSLSKVQLDQEHVWNQTRAEEQLTNSYGYDPQGIRDWNEELQACRELPKGDFMTRLNRDKALIKTHTDFIEASVQGAKAVVEGCLNPINPIDPVNQHVYLYNNIFFSFALDNPDNFRQESGVELSPTVSTSNCDLRNLRILHKLELEDMNVLNTVLVDYKGQRVIAQSIIPGILASEQHSCSEYVFNIKIKNIKQ
ncbi:GSKIP domain [Pseudocohnilembus persalinus]|uniref:GSKIP domain n=1 Tax=Pseudocohnilembus persalinus TaxID=266149 RepID=A0A0V0QXU2_PSEPJ|nr:GSKIP domain [Pseudocohnilembus persalinus]|eukprot:KRX07164.1 GSKIP domain [Pseudocohnilembus persalinus]